MVGKVGFEPTTSRLQTAHADQTALLPDCSTALSVTGRFTLRRAIQDQEATKSDGGSLTPLASFYAVISFSLVLQPQNQTFHPPTA